MPLDDKQREVLRRTLELYRDREMDCDAFVDVLAAYIDDALEPERRALIEHHRAICPECEEELQLLLTGLGR